MSTRSQTAHQKKAFLESFRRLGNVTQAAAEAGCERRTVYSWLEHDDVFTPAYRDAEIQATEVLEAEARRRAVEGNRRVKFSQSGRPLVNPETGEPYVELEYSDTLLIFLLKARAPEKYRDRWEGHLSGPGGAPIQVSHDSLPDRLARYADLAARLAVSGWDVAVPGGDGPGEPVGPARPDPEAG